MRTSVAVLLLCLVVPVFAAAAEQRMGPALADVDVAALDQRVRKIQRHRQAGGVAVAVIDRGGVVWSSIQGTRERGRDNAPLTRSTAMPVGEVGELLVNLVAEDLHARGRIDLDAPLAAAMLPTRLDAAPGSRLPSIRELLNHRSGLVSQHFRGMFERDPAARNPWADIDLYGVQAPGAFELRSPLGIELAAHVLAAVSGHDWEDAVEAALGSSAATMMPAYERRDDAAFGHRKGQPVRDLLPRERIALGAFMSPEQVWALVHGLLPANPSRGSALIGDAARAWKVFEITDPDGTLDLGEPLSFGFRLRRHHDDRAGVEASLVSGLPDSFAGVWMLPRAGVAVVVMANQAEQRDAMRELAEDALTRALKLSLPDLKSPPDDPERSLPDVIGLDARFKPDAPASQYSTIGGLMRVDGDASGFHFELAGWKFAARPRKDGWYRVRLELFGFIPLGFGFLDRIAFLPVRQGNHRLLLVHGRGRHTLVGSALVDRTPAERHWVGRYRLENADAIAREFGVDRVDVVVAHGQLGMRMDVPGMLRLRPLIPLSFEADGVFRVPGLAPGLGERVRFQRERGKAVMLYSGYRLVRDSASR